MGFSDRQMRALRRNLESNVVRSRLINGRELLYIEGWHAISEANRIFGFSAWDRETVEWRCVLAKEIRGQFTAIYIAKVRVTVRAGEEVVVREGQGTGDASGGVPGEVHDMALKSAETDATKRALATFGRPFGLALYLSPRAKSAPKRNLSLDEARKLAAHPQAKESDHATQPVVSPQASSPHPAQAASQPLVPTAQPLVPAQTSDRPLVPEQTTPLVPANDNKIDRSALALAEPKRHRDTGHLEYVMSQPCLLCGRLPSDAHHLRFAQPRALGRKVSDEFTVPLCRVHHRQLHQSGDEVAWWNDLDIDAIAIAQSLWDESREKIGRG
jgi:hypothetical protein